MIHSRQAPGVISPFDGLDVPWLLKMRAEVRRDHPFLIWAPFGAPALPGAASGKATMS